MQKKMKIKLNFFRTFIHLFLLIVWTFSLFYFIERRPEPYYSNIRNFYKRIRREPLKYSELNALHEYNPKSLISIKSPLDIKVLRKDLNKFIYGENLNSKNFNINIYRDIKDNRFNNLISSNAIDKYILTWQNGLNSVAYHFKPKNSLNKLIIYHEGNRGNYFIDSEFGRIDSSKKQIKYFLDQGYDVLALSMPTLGMNAKPIINIPNLGNIKIDKPYKLSLLKNNNSHYLKYFLMPPSKLAKLLSQENNFKSISMVGIGTGGWVTTLTSAVDTNINNSFSVSGTLPLALQNEDFGRSKEYNFENDLSIYKRFNYLDLYILSSSGINRLHRQIYIYNNNKRFAGNRFNLFYEDLASETSKLNISNFDIFVDFKSVAHDVSKEILIYINETIKKNI